MTYQDAVFSIGALAEAVALSPPTIRYYEEIKLIPPARRSAAGHRHYAWADVQRLVFIRRCRELGFGLDQIRQLVSLSISADRDCRDVRDIAAEHLQTVQQKLDELQALQNQLQTFVATCDDVCCGGPGGDCQSLMALAECGS